MAYGYRATLSIAHGQVGGSDLTNFPVYFTGDAGCATVANGGHLINTDSGLPADLIVTSDSAGMTTVPFEIVAGTYNSTTGAMEMHFLVGTVSHTVDTVYYLWIGNAAVTTYQGDDTATWAEYAIVWHLPDGSTVSGADSTANGNNGSLNASPTAITGQLDGGFTASMSSSAVQNLGSLTNNDPGTGPGTLSLWFKTPSAAANNLVFQSDFANEYFSFDYDDGSGKIRAYVGDGSNLTIIRQDSDSSNNAWHLVHFVRDTANSLLKIYQDGVSDATPVTDTTGSITGLLNIIVGSSGGNFGISYDEMRFVLAARSAGWVGAEYNNQKTGQTFLSLGPFVPQGGGSPDLMLYTVMG